MDESQERRRKGLSLSLSLSFIVRKEAEAEEGAPEAMKEEREEEEEVVEAASPAERGEESYCGNRRGERRRAITLHEQPSPPLPHPPRSLLRQKEKSLF